MPDLTKPITDKFTSTFRQRVRQLDIETQEKACGEFRKQMLNVKTEDEAKRISKHLEEALAKLAKLKADK